MPYRQKERRTKTREIRQDRHKIKDEVCGDRRGGERDGGVCHKKRRRERQRETVTNGTKRSGI